MSATASVGAHLGEARPPCGACDPANGFPTVEQAVLAAEGSLPPLQRLNLDVTRVLLEEDERLLFAITGAVRVLYRVECPTPEDCADLEWWSLGVFAVTDKRVMIVGSADGPGVGAEIAIEDVRTVSSAMEAGGVVGGVWVSGDEIELRLATTSACAQRVNDLVDVARRGDLPARDSVLRPDQAEPAVALPDDAQTDSA